MIRSESLQLASLIAMAPNLEVKPTALLQSLSDASVGSMPFGPKFLEEVQYVTSENEHTFIKDELSGQLASIVRDSLATIRDYGVPLAKAITVSTMNIGSTKRIRESALSEVELRYVNVDEPFFDSSVYPTEVRNNSFNYTGVDLSKLDSLDWAYVADDAVREFIATDHPELVGLLDDPECSIGYVAESFFCTNSAGMQGKFHQTGKVFDFTKVKIGDIHFLLKAYILFAKMYACEDPAPWLKGGKLEDYREMVSMIYNGLIVYLINLKKMIIQYRQLGLAISVQKAPRILTDKQNKLQVNGTVYFTNNVLEEVMGKGYAMADLLVGMYFGAAINNRPPSTTAMLGNLEATKADFDRYLSMFVTGATSNLRGLFMDAGYEAIAKFVSACPELKTRLESVREGSREMFSTWMARTFQMPLEHCFIAVGAVDTGEDCIAGFDETAEAPDPRMVAVLNTRLVPIFLEAMGCDLAAEIINSTYVEQQSEDNVLNQRERIRVAVINTLVKRLLVKA